MGPVDLRELAVRVPAGVRVHRPDDVPRAPQEPRVPRHRLRDGGVAPSDRGQARRARAEGGEGMSEKSVDHETVEAEHLQEVDVPAHWAYLLGVLAGGTVLMLGLIALLGG